MNAIWDAAISILKTIQGLLVSLLELMGILRTGGGSGNGDNGGNGDDGGDGGNGDEPEPPDDALDPLKWYEHPTSGTWPKEIFGTKVAYLEVITTKPQVWLLKESKNNPNVLVISTVDSLRPGSNTTPNQRVGAKPSKIVMVEKNGDRYKDVPFSDYCRPFAFDGGVLAFIVMPEQIIDGIYIGDHPDEPLRIPIALAGEYVLKAFYPDWE